MLRFYFTYGSDGQPFSGGWTVVEAPNMASACAVFRAYHPDKTEGLLNCSDVYDEEHFMLSEMSATDNLGSRCHEVIGPKYEFSKEGVDGTDDRMLALIRVIKILGTI